MGNCIVGSPSVAEVISGPRGTRMNIGKCSLVLWFCENRSSLPLDLMTLELRTVEAETVKGVPVSVTGVCQVKVEAYQDTDSGESVLNEQSIGLACQNFLGKSEFDVKETIRMTLEGHQRQILGTLTVEEIYKDRASFSRCVREHIVSDLKGMGFRLVSYVVTQISDENDYMLSLGATQTAIVKREAEEGTAKNVAMAKKTVAMMNSEADIESAMRGREAFVATREQEEQEAAAQRNLNITRAKGLAMVKQEEARAAAAYDIECAVQQQAVVREQTKQKVEAAQIMLEVTDLKMQQEVREKEGFSAARLEEEKNNAESVRVIAEAEASRIRQLGEAEAQSIQAKLLAEAEGLQKRAEAFKQYGEAAIVQSIVDRLPEIVESIAKPLSKVDKMVFVSNDTDSGTASKVTNDINRIIASVPETVGALTGVDLKTAISSLGGNTTSALVGAAAGAALNS